MDKQLSALLDRLDGLEKAATPGIVDVSNGTDLFGPFEGEARDGRRPDENDFWQIADFSTGVTNVGGELATLSTKEQTANAHFYCELRNAWPTLRRALREREADRVEWRLGYMQGEDFRLNPYEIFTQKEFCENFIKGIYKPAHEFFPVQIRWQPLPAAPKEATQ